MTITIPGRPVSQKNQKQIIPGKGGRAPIIVSNPRVKAWHRAAAKELMAWQLSLPPDVRRLLPLSGPLNVAIVCYVPDLVRRDLHNLIQAPMDALVDAGIVADDNWQVVPTLDGSTVRLDRQNPRYEVTIETLLHPR